MPCALPLRDRCQIFPATSEADGGEKSLGCRMISYSARLDTPSSRVRPPSGPISLEKVVLQMGLANPIQSDPSPPSVFLRAVFSSSGGQDTAQSRAAAADSMCGESGHRAAARHLELGGAVGVVHGVTKRRVVAVAHLRVAAQNRVLGILCCGIGACIGPACIVLVCRLGVLICEEGLVPPISRYRER